MVSRASRAAVVDYDSDIDLDTDTRRDKIYCISITTN